jgi:hypothetical protein
MEFLRLLGTEDGKNFGVRREFDGGGGDESEEHLKSERKFFIFMFWKRSLY